MISSVTSSNSKNENILSTVQRSNLRSNNAYYAKNSSGSKQRRKAFPSRNNYDSRLKNKYASDGEAYNEIYSIGKNFHKLYRSRSNPTQNSHGSRSDSDMTDNSVLFLKRKNKLENSEASSSIRSSYDSLSIPPEYDSYHYQNLSSFAWNRTFAVIIGVLLVVGVVITPVAFLIFPNFLWKFPDCNAYCRLQCTLLGFKIAIAAISCYFLFIYRSNATFPRFQPKKLFLLFISMAFIISNWVFFLGGVVYFRSLNYDELLDYVNSIANCVFYILLMAIIIIYLTPIKPKYYLTVVRNTDGERKFYAVGHLTLQEAAGWILEQYYKDFTDYNPYLDKSVFRKIHGTTTNFKFYNFGNSSNPPRDYCSNAAEAIFAAVIKNSGNRCNEQMQAEEEHDRKIKKRRAQLVFVTEEAFSYVRQLSEKEKRFIPSMNASEIACAIFPAIARSFHKYLKSTRQLHLHTTDSIQEHLSRCILLDLSARAFLERYLKAWPVITNEAEQNKTQYWSIIADTAPNQPINGETMFQLCKHETTLVVNVLEIPHFSISESYIDTADKKYMLNLDQQQSSV